MRAIESDTLDLTNSVLSPTSQVIRMRTVLLLTVATLPVLAGAADDACEVGEACSVSGVISIYRTPPAFTASLDADPYCISLALPDSVYSNAASWNGKRVTIRGEAYPNFGGGDGLVTYEVRGRDVTAVCSASPYILFVNEISLTD